MRMPPRRRLAARPTRSPMPGGVRAPGSRANTPTWPPMRASLLLARCNLKHDVVEEADLGDDRLAGYRALLVPNAGHLAGDTIARIERWLGGADRRLVVTGKTNLPPRLLGLRACTPTPVAGYTGWRWRPDSPFAGPAWEAAYATGYAGHQVQPRRAGAGQPRARRPGGVHGRSDQRGHRDGLRARAGHRAHRADGLCRQPGLRAARRHAPGAPERRGRPALGESHPLGRHDPVLPPARAAGRRPRCPVADAAAVVRHATTACCRSATTCTACSTSTSSTTRSRT